MLLKAARLPARVGATPARLARALSSSGPKSVTLSWTDGGEDKSVELPVHSPPSGLGANVIDVQSLYKQTGMFTHDPGFTSTSSCESAVTYLDGEAGMLLHRGYPIDKLAEHANFEETCYLLLHGELPTKAELREWTHDLRHHTMLHQRLIHFFQGFKSDAHPMAIMVSATARGPSPSRGPCPSPSPSPSPSPHPHPHPQVSVVGALSAFYPDSVNIYDENERKLSAVRHSQPQKPQTPQHLKTSKPQNFTATQQNPTPKLKPELKPTLTPPAPHPYAGAHDRQDADDRRARV